MTSPHRPTPAEPFAGLVTTRAAQAAWGEHLVGVARLMPGTLYRFLGDRQALAQAFAKGNTLVVLSEADGVTLEVRGDLLDVGAALDLLALLQPPGPYLPRPYQATPAGVPFADELRTDAADIARDLVAWDREHPGEQGSRHPLPAHAPEDDSAEAHDAARAYLRAEWIYAHEGLRIP